MSVFTLLLDFVHFSIEEKSGVVTGGIRAILDLRTRPLGPNTSLEANNLVCYRVIVANA